MASLGVQGSFYSIPSSSGTPRWTNEVFLSFRGEDTRDNVISHLYAALHLKGIHAFKDDEKLEKGKSISPELLRAIEGSESSIVILSKNYASSRWCLDELVKIVDCKNEKGQSVYPVFYHVDPSEVRKQTGSFGEAFAKVVSKNGMEKVERWKKALEEVGNLSGWPYPSPTASCESKLIEEIVRIIFIKLLNRTYSSVSEDLVGMDSRMEKVIDLLGLGLNDARVVGIWGMGGIGKTTIARVVYNFAFHQFESHSFVENVREVFEKRGLIELQRQLISNILPENVHVSDSGKAKSMIKKIVHSRKVLIVLDDVDETTELEEFIGKPQWFHPGSRIIITTRNKHLLTGYEVPDENIYEVEQLHRNEAIKLLCWKAFGKDQRIGGFKDLLDCAIQYTGRIPLALKVLGALLRGRTCDQWKSALKKLEGSPDHKVLKVLKVSYNDLDPQQQEIFKDIACFLKGMNIESVNAILDSCGLSPGIDIPILIERSLLTLEHNILGMHDLVQQMIWNIVREESEEPGKRSRLWAYEDVHSVLTTKSGTSSVKSLILSAPKHTPFQLRRKAFRNMKNIRLLTICNVQLLGGLKCLPNEMRYLKWPEYPLERFPPLSSQLGHLVELIMHDSDIEQLWEGKMNLPNLRIMELRWSKKLKECPDLTNAPNLVELDLGGCYNLVDVHSSIGRLKRLRTLWLSYTSIQSLPTCMQLESLRCLGLNGCKRLSNIPENLGNMEQLFEIVLDDSAVAEFGTSIGHLPNLFRLSMMNCDNLESLPIAITQLEFIKQLLFRGCVSLKNIPETLGNMTCLEMLNLEGCTKLRRLPESICGLKSLRNLDLQNCPELDRLPENICDMESLERLRLGGSGVRELPSSMANLQKLNALALEGSKGITYNSLKSFFSVVLRTSSLEQPSLSRSLISLYLDKCNLRSIPQEICCFESLEYLDLSSNDFKHLPSTIKALSKLRSLRLSNCKLLEQMPELPPGIRSLVANGCVSLKTMWSPSIYRGFEVFLFIDCLQLVENQESNILTDVILPNQFQGDDTQSRRGFEILLPGNTIPKWFNNTSVGEAPFYFQLPPNWLNDNFLGFAVCAALGSCCDVPTLMDMEIFVNGDCFGDVITIEIASTCKCFKEETLLIAYTKHSFSPQLHLDQLNHGIELRMKFYQELNNGCDVILKFYQDVVGCGLRLVYRDDQTLGDEQNENSDCCSKKARLL